MHLIRKIFCFICLLCPLLAQAQNGIYTTLETGWAWKNSLPSQQESGAQSVDQKNIPAWRMAIGYLHDISSKFGVGFEAARGIYGQYTYRYSNQPSDVAKNSTTEFFIVTELHRNTWDYFVKLGGIRNTTVITNHISDSNITRIQPEAAIGTAYTFLPHWAVTGEYAHSFGNHISNLLTPGWKSPSLDELLVGIRITFY